MKIQSILGHDTALTGNLLPAFWTDCCSHFDVNSSIIICSVEFVALCMDYPDDGGSKHLRNVGNNYQSTVRNVPEDSTLLQGDC